MTPAHPLKDPTAHPRVQQVALANAVAEPWRNGGGMTRTLLTWPLDTADWLVRVSVVLATPGTPQLGMLRWRGLYATAPCSCGSVASRPCNCPPSALRGPQNREDHPGRSVRRPPLGWPGG